MEADVSRGDFLNAGGQDGSEVQAIERAEHDRRLQSYASSESAPCMMR